MRAGTRVVVAWLLVVLASGAALAEPLRVEAPPVHRRIAYVVLPAHGATAGGLLQLAFAGELATPALNRDASTGRMPGIGAPVFGPSSHGRSRLPLKLVDLRDAAYVSRGD